MDNLSAFNAYAKPSINCIQSKMVTKFSSWTEFHQNQIDKRRYKMRNRYKLKYFWGSKDKDKDTTDKTLQKTLKLIIGLPKPSMS